MTARQIDCLKPQLQSGCAEGTWFVREIRQNIRGTVPIPEQQRRHRSPEARAWIRVLQTSQTDIDQIASASLPGGTQGAGT